MKITRERTDRDWREREGGEREGHFIAFFTMHASIHGREEREKERGYTVYCYDTKRGSIAGQEKKAEEEN